MHSRRILLIFAGVVCLALLFLVYCTWKEREELQLQQIVAWKRKAVLQSELRRFAQAAAARVETHPESPVVPPPSPSKIETPAPRPVLRTPSLADVARDNPGLWNEFISSKKAELAQIYGPLFQSLSLSTEQREQFKVIMAAGTARSTDIAAAVDAKQLSRDDPIIAKLYQQSADQTQSELASLLGETGLIQFKEYQRTIQVRGFADGLAIQLAAVEPLSGLQGDRLTSALASTSAGFLRGGLATSADMNWSSADEQARSILTPTQFAIWEQGTAHNPYGGSRKDVELKKFYDQAVKANAMKPADGGMTGIK